MTLFMAFYLLNPKKWPLFMYYHATYHQTMFHFALAREWIITKKCIECSMLLHGLRERPCTSSPFRVATSYWPLIAVRPTLHAWRSRSVPLRVNMELYWPMLLQGCSQSVVKCKNTRSNRFHCIWGHIASIIKGTFQTKLAPTCTLWACFSALGPLD